MTPHPSADPILLPTDATRLVKRSVVVAGHKTSISLEDVFWTALKQAAERRCLTVTDLVTAIDAGRTGNLSSALRVFLLLEAEVASNSSKISTIHTR